MSLFFINRPVFAWVIAIIIMLAGILSIKNLPVEHYPNISSPSIEINAHFPGASAEILSNSVTQILEQKLTGIDNMRYFKASSSSSGAVSINVVFDPGTNSDIAQVQVQNKVNSAIPMLPLEVQKSGIGVTKNTTSFLIVVGFYSENPAITESDIGDLVHSKIRDALARVNGVGDVKVFGSPKAMRIWLNPHKLNEYGLTIGDVTKSLEVQNSDVSAGHLGGAPAVKGQQINVSITTQSKLKTVDDFNEIIIRVKEDGSQIRLKDVANVELGANNYDMVVRYKKFPSAGIAVSPSSGANALKTAEAVKKKINELRPFIPKDIKIIYPYDNTPFIKLAIKEVIYTLIEAVALVFLIMFLFLQNFRATLIPTIAIPVVLLGTFTLLYIFGFTINVLTLFAMVLAIGLLVDDAIVVVENVERVMHEEGISAKEATIKSMRQITGALIGIALVLTAVFVPMMFFSGTAGEIYKQFSFTIASTMILSVLVALILSPSLCASMLTPTKKQSNFFIKFNNCFDNIKSKILKISNSITNKISKYLFFYLTAVVCLVMLFMKIPTSFVPDEDTGVMFLTLQTPPGSTIERTLEKVEQVEDYFIKDEANTVKDVFTVTGFSFSGQAQNVALGFVNLQDWQKRTKKHQSVFQLATRSGKKLSTIKDTFAFAFYPPSIPALGRFSGFDLQLVDRKGLGHEGLTKAKNLFLSKASKNPKLSSVRANGLPDVPQFKIIIDREKSSALGLKMTDINDTLQTAWGSTFVNNFIDKDRVKKVVLQSEAKYRMMPNDIRHWHVRNDKNNMVPLDSISTFKWTYGSPKLERFNGSESININGASSPGVSTGESMKEIENIVESLPVSIGYEWSGLSYEEKLNSSQTAKLYVLSILAVFLCLAALYESWTVPISVILSVPLGIIGVVLAALIFKLNNDVYFQVALLTTIGLTAKNAILIVEFAKTLHEKGVEVKEATFRALKVRFRPIIMTSMAFVLGVLPLAISSGIGSGSQNAIGISVIGGMLSATFIATLFVPMFFVIVSKISSKSE